MIKQAAQIIGLLTAMTVTIFTLCEVDKYVRARVAYYDDISAQAKRLADSMDCTTRPVITFTPVGKNTVPVYRIAPRNSGCHEAACQDYPPPAWGLK